MSGITFDPEDLDLEAGELGDDESGGEGEKPGDPPKPAEPASPAQPWRVPDDYEDADLRGLDGPAVVKLLQQSKDLTRRVLDQSKSTADAAVAAAHAASSRPAADNAAAEEDYRLTKEELLTGDPDVVNRKLDALFSAKATPVVTELYRVASYNSLAAAKTDASMPYFQDYEDEIVRLANDLPLNVTANPQTWKHLYSRVVSLHQDEIIEKEIERRTKDKGGEEKPPERNGRRPDPSGSTGDAGRGGPPAAAQRQLSTEQKRMARLLGVSEEDYLKHMPDEE